MLALPSRRLLASLIFLYCYVCVFSDVTPPLITDMSFNANQGPSWLIRPGATLSLSFRLTDSRELATGSPPPSLSVSIGPPGSAPPSFVSASNAGGNLPSFIYSYTWLVPTVAPATTFGYSINASDAAGNWAVLSAASVLVLGASTLRLFCL